MVRRRWGRDNFLLLYFQTLYGLRFLFKFCFLHFGSKRILLDFRDMIDWQCPSYTPSSSSCSSLAHRVSINYKLISLAFPKRKASCCKWDAADISVQKCWRAGSFTSQKHPSKESSLLDFIFILSWKAICCKWDDADILVHKFWAAGYFTSEKHPLKESSLLIFIWTCPALPCPAQGCVLNHVAQDWWHLL